LPEALGAEFAFEEVADTVVDKSGLTIDGAFGQAANGKSFQQDVLVTHNQVQYIAYYDAERHVCVGRRTLPSGKWEILRLEDYRFGGQDAHNTISMGICPRDGTIHLAFDHHGHPLHYRVSRKGVATEPVNIKWGPELFGPVMSELEEGKPVKGVTYPRFLQTPEGGLQLCYRVGASGNGDRVLVDYDPDNGVWKDTRRIDSGKGEFTDSFNTSPSRCSYPNGYDYGSGGRLHVTWVWRERTQGANHDLCYAYSDDRGHTWRNTKGKIVGVGDSDIPGSRTLSVHSPDIVAVPISRAYGTMNTQAQAVDSKGRIHVVMWHCSDDSLKAARTEPESCWGPPDARRYHHYWRGLEGEWHHAVLPGLPGNRPKLFFDKNDDAFLIYGASQGTGSYNRGSAPRDLVVSAATAGARWTDWHVAHVEKGPFVNEMLADRFLWKSQGILSVLVQEFPAEKHASTPVRVVDYRITAVKPD